jgi:hypothetical protein
MTKHILTFEVEGLFCGKECMFRSIKYNIICDSHKARCRLFNSELTSIREYGSIQNTIRCDDCQECFAGDTP